jgi:hypothetical protein
MFKFLRLVVNYAVAIEDVRMTKSPRKGAPKHARVLSVNERRTGRWLTAK